MIKKQKWGGGLAEWRDGDTYYLSAAFTWKRVKFHDYDRDRKSIIQPSPDQMQLPI